jgi:hypothetical protein
MSFLLWGEPGRGKKGPVFGVAEAGFFESVESSAIAGF